MPGAIDLWIPRLLFQGGLEIVYFIAFLVAANQFRPLLGEHGLQPVPLFVNRIAFQDSPSLFLSLPRIALSEPPPGSVWRSPAHQYGLHRTIRYGGFDGRMGRDVASLYFIRQRGANILLVRLGDHAARSRILRHLPGGVFHASACDSALGLALDGVPRRVRRRPDQAARRPLAGARSAASIITLSQTKKAPRLHSQIEIRRG
jgi:hypothetical protein